MMRNGEAERRADVRSRLTRDLTAMTPNQRLHVDKSHTLSRRVLPADATKQLKDSGNIVLSDTPTIIAGFVANCEVLPIQASGCEF